MSANKTVAELVKWICPNKAKARHWPPDVFAVAAYLLDITGGYVLATEFGSGHGTFSWHKRANTIAQKWSSASCRKSATLRAPKIVSIYWNRIFTSRLTLSDLDLTNPSPQWRRLIKSIIRALSIADAAAAGYGISSDPNDIGLGLAFKFLISNENQSLCESIDRKILCVLPKQHTPQCGLTLRSLSHNLAFLPNQGIKTSWISPLKLSGRRKTSGANLNNRSPSIVAHRTGLDSDIINILLCPWPLDIDSRDFSLVTTAPGHSIRTESIHRFFSYEPISNSLASFFEYFSRAVKNALETCRSIHIAVFPELSLSDAELSVAKQIAEPLGIIVLAGVRKPWRQHLFRNTAVVSLQPFFTKFHVPPGDESIQDADESSRSAKLLEIFQLLDSEKSTSSRTDESQDFSADFIQEKHHRWTLDQRQIVRYGLGSVLPVCHQVWEWTPIQERRVNFFTIEDWLTWTTLICEDLARQDPVSNIIRSVAPNLVISLLMDGPQLVNRWPARYASILADDPGTSVLTLTCLGMINRSSRDDYGKAIKPIRSIALWSDAASGTRQIDIDDDADCVVLSVSRMEREEWTADGRSDGRVSAVPVYVGHHSVKKK